MNAPTTFKKDEDNLCSLVQVHELAKSLDGNCGWKTPFQWLRTSSGRLFSIAGGVSRKNGRIFGTADVVVAYASWLGPKVHQRARECFGAEQASNAEGVRKVGVSVDKHLLVAGKETKTRAVQAAQASSASNPAATEQKDLGQISSFVMQAATLAARVKGADSSEVARESLKIMQELSGIAVYDRLKKAWAPKPDMSEMPVIQDADEVPNLTATELAKPHGMTAQALNKLFEEHGIITRNSRNDPELKKAWSHIGMMVPFTGANNHTGFRLLYNRKAHDVIKLLIRHATTGAIEAGQTGNVSNEIHV